MRATWDAAKSHLALEPVDREEAESFLAEASARKGFMVALSLQLPLFAKCSVGVVIGGSQEVTFDAEVAQAFPMRSGSWNTAFLAPTVPPLPSGQQQPEQPTDESESRGASPVFRIKQMNPNEKARLAARAGRQERQVLLRDSSPTVLQSLLTNPRIEARDVLRIVKSTHANGGLLKRIAEDGRWGKNQEILAHVVKNPKTPPPLATRLIDRLRTSDLRLMGKMSSGLREDVRRAALREYLRRSGT